MRKGERENKRKCVCERERERETNEGNSSLEIKGHLFQMYLFDGRIDKRENCCGFYDLILVATSDIFIIVFCHKCFELKSQHI